MPLAKGKGRKVIARNIHEMFAAGHPHDQAVAAALHEADISGHHGDMHIGEDPAAAYWRGHADGASRAHDLLRVGNEHTSYADASSVANAIFNPVTQANAVGGAISNAFTAQGGAPAQNPNAYQYGGYAGGAQAAQQQYQNAGNAALNQAAPTVNNAYGTADRSQTSGVMQGEQGLQNFYAGQMNGTGPNLAAAQSQASTDQGIAAQQAAANSSRGALASAGAQRGAALNAAQAQQANAQNSAMATIQQQYNAANASAGLYGQQGQQALQQSGQDIQNAQYGAGLQEQQNALGAGTALGYAGLGAQVGGQQLAAQEAGQQYNLQAAGLNQQNSQFNAGQKQNAWGAVIGGLGSMIGADFDLHGFYRDAQFEEPGNPSNGWTLREEAGGPDHAPFILAADRENGGMFKVAMDPLTPAEAKQVARPHGAGPLDAPDRKRTVVHDMGLGGDPMAIDMTATPDAGDLAMASAAQQAGTGQYNGQATRPAAMMGNSGASGDIKGSPFAMGAKLDSPQYGPKQLESVAPNTNNPNAIRQAALSGLQWGQHNPLAMQAPPIPMAPMADGDLTRKTSKEDEAFLRGLKEATNPAFSAHHAEMRPYLPASGSTPAMVLSPMGYVPADPSGVYERNAGALPLPPNPPGMTTGQANAMGPFGDLDMGRHYADAILPDVPQQAYINRASKNAPVDAGLDTGFLARASGVTDPISNAIAGEITNQLGYGGTTGAKPQAEQPADPSTLVRLQQPAATPPQAAPKLPPAAGAGAATNAWVPNARPGEIQTIEAANKAKAEGQQLGSVADQMAIANDQQAHQARADVLGKDAEQQAKDAADFKAHVTDLESEKKAFGDLLAKKGEDYGFHPTAMQSLRFTLAKGLGALGSGLNHGMQNFALQEYNAKVDRELDRQKQQIEAAKGRVANIDSALADAYRLTGHLDSAAALVRGTIKEKGAEETLAIRAGSASAKVSADAQVQAAELDKQAARDLDPYFAHRITGGAGQSPTRAQIIARAQHLRDANPSLSTVDATKQALAEYQLGEPQGGLPGKGGAGRPNPDAEALETLANDKSLHGQDLYDRNAPDFLRSSESLRNEAGLRALANASQRSGGARAAPVTVPTSAVLNATYGRPDDESVRAVQARERKVAESKKRAGNEAKERELEADE
jgi:hypothetical protein